MSVLMILVQDTQVQDDGKAALKKAVEATLKSSVKVEGKVSRDSADNGNDMAMIMKALGRQQESFEGKFTGIVSGDEAHLKVEGSNIVSDVFRRGDKVVKRQTWVAKRKGIDDFAQDATTLTNLNRFKAALEKGKVKDVKSDDKTQTIKGTLPTRFMESGEEEEEGDPNNPMNQIMKMGLGGKETLKRVEFKATIDKESGRITKLTYTLVKESALGGNIRIMAGQGFGQQDQDQDEDEDNGGKKKAKKVARKLASEVDVIYSLELSATDGKVEIPKDMEKFFTE
jgi:hypothetical protein